MKKIYYILACYFSLVSWYASATTLTFDLKDGHIRTTSLIPINDDKYIPSGWEVMSGLSSTNRWVPSTHANQPTSIRLNGPNSEVTFPLKVVGLEYNMGSLAQNQNSRAGTCTVQSSSSNTIALLGSANCSAPVEFTTSSMAIPFYFIRPIIEVNEGEVNTAFKDKPSGRYTGVLAMVARYAYYTASGAITYRNISYNISVSVNFQPANLVSVDVIGDGVMPPIYNKNDKTVTAKFDYRVIAKGEIPNGVNIRFNRTNGYHLTHSNGVSIIPYSLSCDICSPNNQVVENGILQSESLTASNGAAGSNSLTINFSFKYEAERDDVETGLYSDIVTMIFEANI